VTENDIEPDLILDLDPEPDASAGAPPGRQVAPAPPLGIVVGERLGVPPGATVVIENVRRPFFLLVSVAAIAFIMTLYRRLLPRQRALKWGLPLVLGGALGNVLDRIRYGQVIDFIDVHVVYRGVERHWPTFNVADVAICVGVGLMALDMFATKRAPPAMRAPSLPPAQSGEASVDWTGGPPLEPGSSATPDPSAEA
jgi:signal peptidase II